MKYLSKIAMLIAVSLLPVACTIEPSSTRTPTPTSKGTKATVTATGSPSAARTDTGYYWPTGASEPGHSAGYKDSGCDGAKDFTRNLYNLGLDIDAEEGAAVYAIADGIVRKVSRNGWGEGNVGVLVEHKVDDGASFIAVYGFVRTSVTEGSALSAGKSFATVGAWQPAHLHFGIRQPASLDEPYVMAFCPLNNTFGFLDPIDWITTTSPGKMEAQAAANAKPTAKAPPANQPKATARATGKPPAPTAEATPEIEQPALDKTNIDAIMLYVSGAVKGKQAAAIANVVGSRGAQFYPYGVGGEFLGRNNGQEVAGVFADVFKTSKPSCMGFDPLYGTEPDKAMLLFKGLKIPWDRFKVDETSDVTGFQFFKFDEGWELVYITPVPDYGLPATDAMHPCP